MIIASPDWAFNGAIGGYGFLMRNGGEKLMTALWIIDTEDDEWGENNPCEHVDNCDICYPDAYTGWHYYVAWIDEVEMDSYINSLKKTEF